MNLIKEVKNLYTENYTALMKKTEKDTNIRKDSPYLCITKFNVVKMPISLKTMEIQYTYY